MKVLALERFRFLKELYIEREDFKEDASSNFFRLTLGKEVRLKNAYIIKADHSINDHDGLLKKYIVPTIQLV